MSEANDPVEPLFRLRPRTLLLVLLMLVGATAILALRLALLPQGEAHALMDFEAFHLVGRMHWLGVLEEAYTFDLFLARQATLADSETFMPWTYPPAYDFVTALLALMPLGPSFLVFVLVTLAGYVAVLRRVAGEHFAVVAVAVLPVFVLNVLIGQNGFLSGTLVGLYVLMALRGARWSGVALGLMVIKPHLALGLGVHLLLARRWAWVAQAFAVIAGTAALSTLAFGPGIWPAFLHGLEESGVFLASGMYPLQRMTSAYAGLRSFGIDSRIALGVHLGVTLCGLAMVQVAVTRGWRTERALATALLATLMVSPYNYDYDLTILGLALALVLRTLADPDSRRLWPVVLGLCLFVGIYPLGVSLTSDWALVQAVLVLEERPYALAPFAFLALVALLFGMMWKAERAAGGAGAARPALG